jgi:hypothetical protein
MMLQGGLHGVRGRVFQGVRRPSEALDHHGRAQRDLHRRLRQRRLPAAPRRCTEGNSTVEPYVVGHNSILAHAATVKLYPEKYQVVRNRPAALVITRQSNVHLLPSSIN